MNLLSRVGLVVLIALAMARLLAFGGFRTTITTVRPIPPTTPLLILDAGNRTVTQSEEFSLSLARHRVYDWTLTVKLGQVALSLLNKGRVSWSFNLSNSTVWSTSQASVPFGGVANSDYVGLITSAGPGSISFTFYPGTTGVYQLVAENQLSGNGVCMDNCHLHLIGGIPPTSSTYSVQVTTIVQLSQ